MVSWITTLCMQEWKLALEPLLDFLSPVANLSRSTFSESFSLTGIQLWMWLRLSDLNQLLSGLIKPSNRGLRGSIKVWVECCQFTMPGKKPTTLSPDELNFYYNSLFLMKNSQNPQLGTFVASFHPAYGFKVWARDGVFSALIMDEAGYPDEAALYLKWMSTAQLRSGRTNWRLYWLARWRISYLLWLVQRCRRGFRGASVW